MKAVTMSVYGFIVIANDQEIHSESKLITIDMNTKASFITRKINMKEKK